MKLPVLTTTGIAGAHSVENQLFDVVVKPTLLAQAARVYMSNLRQATSKVKTRSEINRTKKKWYRQKGTGGARHGAKTANLFVGGGVAHGPTGEQNFNRNLTTLHKQKALLGALNQQVKNCFVVSGWQMIDGTTQKAAKFMLPVSENKYRTLVILPEYNAMLLRATGNLPLVLIRSVQDVNAMDVMSADKIIFDDKALELLSARLQNGLKSKKAGKSVAQVKPAKVDDSAKTETKKPAVKKPVVKAVVAKKPAGKKATVKKSTKSTTK